MAKNVKYVICGSLKNRSLYMRRNSYLNHHLLMGNNYLIKRSSSEDCRFQELISEERVQRKQKWKLLKDFDKRQVLIIACIFIYIIINREEKKQEIFSSYYFYFLKVQFVLKSTLLLHTHSVLHSFCCGLLLLNLFLIH